MTPLLTMGAASWTLASPVENTHTGRRRLTLSGVMFLRGLKPQPSYVRRIINQLPSSGFLRRSAVTGW